MTHEIENLSDRNVRTFTKTDTVYISKLEGGYSLHYLCKFNRIENGCVVGNAISCSPTWGMHRSSVGIEIKSRITKCYLWGKGQGDAHPRCHWFLKDGICD